MPRIKSLVIVLRRKISKKTHLALQHVVFLMRTNNRIFDKFTLRGVYYPMLRENIVRGKQKDLSLMAFRFKGDFPLNRFPLRPKYLLIM